MHRENCSGGFAARADGLLLLSLLDLFYLLRLFCFLSHDVLFVCWAAALDGPAAPHAILGSPDSAWSVCKGADDSCWQRFRQSDRPTPLLGHELPPGKCALGPLLPRQPTRDEWFGTAVLCHESKPRQLFSLI